MLPVMYFRHGAFISSSAALLLQFLLEPFQCNSYRCSFGCVSYLFQSAAQLLCSLIKDSMV